MTNTTDSSGLEIVTYPGDDHPLDWTADTVVVLGGAGVEPSDSAFFSVSAVDADAAGNIYVLDGDEARVLAYDSTGRFLRRVGAKGGGPGEFEMPIAMSVSPDAIVSVFDFSKRALVRFERTGQTLDEIRMEQASSGGDFETHGDVLLHNMRDRSPADGNSVRWTLVRIADSQTTDLLRVDQTMSGAIHLESCGIRFAGLPQIFAPPRTWTARDGRVAGAIDHAYNVRIISGDSLVRMIRRDLPMIPATTERAVASVGPGMTVGLPGGERTCSSEEVVEKRGVADVVPLIAKLAIAPDGAIWISRNTDQHGRTLTDIFDISGNYLGTLPSDYPFPDAFVSPQTIVVRDEDEMGVARVLVIRRASSDPT